MSSVSSNESDYSTSSASSNGTTDFAIVAAAVQVSTTMMEDLSDTEDEIKIDHRVLPRSQRTNWRHADALYCIRRDYIGIVGDLSTPTLDDFGFQRHFRISKSRFERIIQDVGNAHIPFYRNNIAADGRIGSSMEAKLLLPLKCLAYGVPPHCFQDYFQMSAELARQCCNTFDTTIKKVYQGEYLRLPTDNDVKAIFNLHHSIHGIKGMFGSLDCSHTYWKNCPKAWQGSFKGKEQKPSVVLEAIADHHLWFWHASYG